MKTAIYPDCQVVEISRGEAAALDKGLFDPRISTVVRYADPAAWVVATAVARAMAPVQERVAAARDTVGVVVTSAHGPAQTIAAVAQTVREGYISPLRYPAANPASFVGVTCAAFGLRGPTLNLLLSPRQGVPLALFLAGQWIERRTALCVFVASCERVDAGGYRGRAALLGGAAFKGDWPDLRMAGTDAWMLSGAAEPAAP